MAFLLSIETEKLIFIELQQHLRKAGIYVDAEVRNMLAFEENLDMKFHDVNSYSKTL